MKTQKRKKWRSKEKDESTTISTVCSYASSTKCKRKGCHGTTTSCNGMDVEKTKSFFSPKFVNPSNNKMVASAHNTSTASHIKTQHYDGGRVDSASNGDSNTFSRRANFAGLYLGQRTAARELRMQLFDSLWVTKLHRCKIWSCSRACVNR